MSVPNLPPYTFLEKLGKGTNGTVFKAHKKIENKKFVAIKCILKKILNKSASDNLVSEISILKEVKHEYIVDLIDFTWDANFIYLILEYCPGGDLYRYIKKHSFLQESVVYRFLQQLALALQFLYKKSILHMDLKPPNILLTSQIRPKLKLADFGFAKSIEGTVNMDDLRGSLLYMAPEVYTYGTYSAKCDLWSVGVIIYECLVGKAPFHSDTLESLKTKIVDKDIVMIPQENPNGIRFSDNCFGLMTGLLKRDMDERMSYEEFLAHPFVDIEHSPTSHSYGYAIKVLNACKTQEEIWREKFRLSSIGRRQRRIDNVLELKKIYKDYLDGLSHMMAAIHYEDDESRRNMLKEILSERFHHIEALQQELSSLNDNLPSNKDDDLSLLESEIRDSIQLKEGINCLRDFYNLIERNHLKEAIDLFTKIFERIYPLIKEDSSTSRKDLFYKELNYAMSIAETAKTLIKDEDVKTLQKRRDSVGKDSCNIS